jgi:diguanylate cyclase (GGDEF)-like protein
VGETASLAVFGGMFLLLLLGVAWLAFQRAQMARRLHELEALPAQLARLVTLVRSISASDWTSSAASLLEGIASSDGIAYAALLGLSDNGHLELRVSHGQSPAGYDPCLDPQAIGARERGAMATDPRAGVAYIPVVEENQVVGMLVARGPGLVGIEVRQAPLEQQHLRLLYLAAAAELTGVTLAGIQAFQKQAALSLTDGLTGLFNHRHFHQLLGIHVSQAYLNPAPLSLILLDIDHFKNVNDTYGHLTGDLVLREISNLLRRAAPAGAVVARYGGEEFAVLLPGVGSDEAQRLAEHLRSQVAGHVIFDYATGNRISVTISLGAGQFTLGLGKSEFVNMVDAALYASKRSGRNRVTLAAAVNPAAGTESKAGA